MQRDIPLFSRPSASVVPGSQVLLCLLRQRGEEEEEERMTGLERAGEAEEKSEVRRSGSVLSFVFYLSSDFTDQDVGHRCGEKVRAGPGGVGIRSHISVITCALFVCV